MTTLTHDRHKPTSQRAVGAFCTACMGAARRRSAYDCLSSRCLLYPANPLRGKAIPVALRPPDYDGEPNGDRPAKHRATKPMIRAYCYTCQPEDRTDCQATDCAFYPFRPWAGPGHAEKRQATPQALAALGIARQKAKTLQRGAGFTP